MTDDVTAQPAADDNPADAPSIVAALGRVKAEVRAVRKDERNPQQGYAFRGIDAVVNAVASALTRHGVIVAPMTERADWRDVQTSTGKASRECTVSVRYRFYGPSGDYLDAVVPGESMDFGDKGAPKAMSVAYRIALLQTLTLPTDDIDPDATSFDRGAGTPAATTHAAPAATTPSGAPLGAQAAAAAARQALRTTCADNGFDLDIVAARYAAEHNEPLKTSIKANQIDKFRQSLAGVPAHELRKPDPGASS